ncbi:MAG: GntR family transcriptional regulator [Methylacidiphilales bacterium]|nr:GntR family transcriptional regulator [Candidatus Methylacidiphilales bacterium]
MLPFNVQIKPGSPAYEQVVYAVQKALIIGKLKPGDRFPSVRQLSQELRINPNTAHKIVAHLTAEGLLQVEPGIGTVVQKIPAGSSQDKSVLLNKDLERLVVGAKRLSLGLSEVTQALEKHWEKIS